MTTEIDPKTDAPGGGALPPEVTQFARHLRHVFGEKVRLKFAADDTGKQWGRVEFDDPGRPTVRVSRGEMLHNNTEDRARNLVNARIKIAIDRNDR
jgi:hypothetical protein